MNRFSAFKQPILLQYFALLACLAFITVGCDNVDATSGDPAEVPALTVADIEFTRAVPVVSKAGEAKYHFEVGLKPAKWRSRIRGLQMLARSAEEESIILIDDGSGPDKKAKDGIYTAIIPASCIPGTGGKKDQSRAGKAPEISCKIKFVGPGEECADFGECPSRVERSLLFGLITYETDIVVCFCIDECTITFGG